MSFQSSVNFVNTPQNFAVRQPAVVIRPNKAQGLVTGRVSVQTCGTGSSSIPVNWLVNDTLVVTPLTAGQSFGLPSAQQILSEFGDQLNVPSVAAGDQLHLTVVNKGSFPCYIAATGSGGDGSIAIVYPAAGQAGFTGSYGPSYTGSVTPVGRTANLVIEWLQVNAGSTTANATGLYTIYV